MNTVLIIFCFYCGLRNGEIVVGSHQAQEERVQAQNLEEASNHRLVAIGYELVHV
jgi:hypothetical protein